MYIYIYIHIDLFDMQHRLRGWHNMIYICFLK